jgi:inner membrane protein
VFPAGTSATLLSSTASEYNEPENVEPITHFLFGGVLARAGLNRKSALATATLVLAAEAPDLDVVANFGGRLSGFEHHRGITHTLAGLPFVAALVILVLWIYWRWRGARKVREWQPPPRWGLLYAFALLAGVSHILLDFTNNYGVRPFAPFSYRWYSWDIVFIAEPVLWAILLGALLLPGLFRLVNEEVRASRRRLPPARTGAITALVLIVLFWGVRDFEHRRALAAMQALQYKGENPIRVSAYPYYVNPFRWYGVVETRDFFQSMIVDSLRPEVDPAGRALIYYKPAETPVTLAAKQSRLGRVYLDWAQYPLLEVEQLNSPEEGYLVRFYDLRFRYPDLDGRKVLRAWVQLDRRFKVVAQNFGPWEPGNGTQQAKVSR